jgi:hypothetical protein
VAHTRSRRHRGRRPPMSVLRPILTIQRSQGFVWNQVPISNLTPPYILTTNAFSGPLRSTIHKGSLYVVSISPLVSISTPHLPFLSFPRRCFHFTTHHFWRILRLRFHVHFSRRL